MQAVEVISCLIFLSRAEMDWEEMRSDGRDRSLRYDTIRQSIISHVFFPPPSSLLAFLLSPFLINLAFSIFQPLSLSLSLPLTYLTPISPLPTFPPLLFRLLRCAAFFFISVPTSPESSGLALPIPAL